MAQRHRLVGIKVTLIHIADEFRNCANYGKHVMFVSVNMIALPITENFMIP
jgi:hypothetical protein